MFKVGDKIVRKEEFIIPNCCHAYDGTVATVICDDGDNVRYTFGDFQHSSGFSDRFELYKEKEMFDMLTHPWYINVTQETFPAVNQWLRENYKGKQYPLDYIFSSSVYLTNCETDGQVVTRVMQGSDAGSKAKVAKEIILSVEYRVSNVVFTSVETEAQKKMKELEDKQREIAEELAKLRESM